MPVRHSPWRLRRVRIFCIGTKSLLSVRSFLPSVLLLLESTRFLSPKLDPTTDTYCSTPSWFHLCTTDPDLLTQCSLVACIPFRKTYSRFLLSYSHLDSLDPHTRRSPYYYPVPKSGCFSGLPVQELTDDTFGKRKRGDPVTRVWNRMES